MGSSFRNGIRKIISFAAAAAVAVSVTIPCAGALTPALKVSPAYSSGVYAKRLSAVTLTGNYRTDLLLTALSQVGYHEGNVKSEYAGQSYYGWHNCTEYSSIMGTDGSWCAMFISWCARQAGIPESVISSASQAVANGGYYSFHTNFKSRGSYTPVPGDLIFFLTPGWHVGIVLEVSGGMVTTIEGNSGNAVRVNRYALNDGSVSGYGVYSSVPADMTAVPYTGSDLLRFSALCSDGVFGRDPEGCTYEVSSFCALKGREMTIYRDLYRRDGWTLLGFYLYRGGDGKFLTDAGWQTGRDIISGGGKPALISNGATIVPDDSYTDGCTDPGVFTLCPVWKSIGSGEVVQDGGAPFIGAVDSVGWYYSQSDIKEAEWYFQDVKYAEQNGILSGVSAWKFGTRTVFSRAMLAASLKRIVEGGGDAFALQAGESAAYTDVPAGAWYESAADWAGKYGLISGCGGGLFCPGDAVTREQFVTVLWRSVGSPETGFDLSSYADAGDVSPYALEAMEWAAGSGIVSGSGNRLSPKSSATRAQAAALLHRFIAAEGIS